MYRPFTELNVGFTNAESYQRRENHELLMKYIVRDVNTTSFCNSSAPPGKRKFSYDEFLEAFNEFVTEASEAGRKLPQFFESAQIFLQFIYEMNVVCFKESDDTEDGDRKEPFIRWCFRERTLSNMAPKVRIGVEYEIFYGLGKALNLGRHVRVKKSAPKRRIETIISIDAAKGFGFIRGGEFQSEYYFKLDEFESPRGLAPSVSQKVSFEVHVKYARPRAVAVIPTR